MGGNISAEKGSLAYRSHGLEYGTLDELGIVVETQVIHEYIKEAYVQGHVESFEKKASHLKSAVAEVEATTEAEAARIQTEETAAHEKAEAEAAANTAIAATIKGKSARREVERLKAQSILDEKKEAAKVAAAVSFFQACSSRKEIRRLKEEEIVRESEAGVMIGAIFKGKGSRQKFQTLRSQGEVDEHIASTRIVATMNGRALRLGMEDLKYEEMLDRHAAASTINAGITGRAIKGDIKTLAEKDKTTSSDRISAAVQGRDARKAAEALRAQETLDRHASASTINAGMGAKSVRMQTQTVLASHNGASDRVGASIRGKISRKGTVSLKAQDKMDRNIAASKINAGIAAMVAAKSAHSEVATLRLIEAESRSASAITIQASLMCVKGKRIVAALEMTELRALEVLDSLERLFKEADADGSGKLDPQELSETLYEYYKANGQSRPKSKVLTEVSEAMKVYDIDGNGSLEFDEFLRMSMGSDKFKFNIPSEVKVRVLELGEDWAAKNESKRLTPEQLESVEQVLATLASLFEESDTDGNGALDEDELTEALFEYYNEGGAGPPKEIVREEVEIAMREHDVDQSGNLPFDQFCGMAMKGHLFHFLVHPKVKQRVVATAEEMQIKRDALEVLKSLCQFFSDADVDGSGALDHQELTDALSNYYKRNGQSRPQKRVEIEVLEAMKTYDVDQGGTLDQLEFIHMAMESDKFKFLLPEKVKKRVISLSVSHNIRNEANQVLDQLSSMFDEADTDKSGALDEGELTETLYNYYKASEQMRPRKIVRQAVKEAIYLS